MAESTVVTVPHENVNDESVTLVAWLIRDGQVVVKDQPLAELQSSKATFEVHAPHAGVVHYTLASGCDLPVGGILCLITPAPGSAPSESSPFLESAPAAFPSEVVPVVPEPGTSREDHTARFSRAALRLLEQEDLDPSLFTGKGLIRERDILAHLGRLPTAATTASVRDTVSCVSPAPSVSRGPIPVQGVPFRTEPLPRTKRAEIKYLESAHDCTLPSTVSIAVPTRGFRRLSQGHPVLQGNSLAVVVYECARLLRQYPHFNALYRDGNWHLYEEVNLGIAMDLGQGLKVPVLRNADKKDMPQLVQDMRELVVQYLNNVLPVNTLSGGTFTLTDLSSEGVLDFVPRLNQGQAAILGIGTELFPQGDQNGYYKLILTFDHQVSEGREAARFLKALASRLCWHEDSFRQSQAANRTVKDLQCWECLRTVAEVRELGGYLVSAIGAEGTQLLTCTLCLMGF